MAGKIKPYEPLDDTMAELFQKHPSDAIELLNDILADEDQGDLLVVLRWMTKAFGGVHKVAELANLNPKSTYRVLSREGNPELRSLSAILRAMGMRLAVTRLAHK